VPIALAAVQIVVAAPPGASFDVSPSNPAVGDNVTFTSTTGDPDADGDTITLIEWDFEDNGSFDATGAETTHAYSTAGTTTVRMKVTDSAGEVAETTADVTVSPPPNTPPHASLSHAPTSPLIGEQVTFDGSGSSDAEGPVSYAWDLDNDGDFDDGTGAEAARSFGSAGPKTVRLKVTDAGGLSDVEAKTVEVNGPPVADFTFAPGTPNVGQAVTFRSASTDPNGDQLSYAWDTNGDGSFNDGTSATATRTFTTNGPKTVRLRVRDGSGLSDVQTKTVDVNGAPTARFTFTPAVALEEEEVTFTSTSTDPDNDQLIYAWDTDNDDLYDDGTGPTAKRKYGSTGTKEVKLKVTDPGGLSDTEIKVTVKVHRPPVARVVVTPATPGRNDPVTLSGSTSTDADGPLSHAWDLDNDGVFGETGGIGQPEENGEQVTHTFSAPGPQSASLRVTDFYGATDVKTVRINRKPEPGFIFLPEAPITNREITFSETAADPDGDATIATFSWDLDNDGTFGEAGETGEHVTYTFNSAGAKTVRLRVTDDLGASEVARRTVQVENTRPNAAFGFGPDSPLPGQQITFNSTSNATAGKLLATHEWDFDHRPGAFSPDAAGASVNHSFATAGDKTVALRVTEEDGGFNIVTRTLTVNAPPTASFYSADSALDGEIVTFSSTSSDPDGPIAGHQWDLDNDGQFDDAAGAVASRSFHKPGTYTVGLRVTDARGAAASASKAVTVVARPLELLAFAAPLRVGVTRKATRIKWLYVEAPAGTTVTVKCAGRGCPDGNRRKTGRQRWGYVRLIRGKRLRLRPLERSFRPRARIVISGTKPGFIGKQVAYTIRRGLRPPLKQVLCLAPGTPKGGACPPS
jgi:PKD repeat protein